MVFPCCSLTSELRLNQIPHRGTHALQCTRSMRAMHQCIIDASASSGSYICGTLRCSLPLLRFDPASLRTKINVQCISVQSSERALCAHSTAWIAPQIRAAGSNGSEQTDVDHVPTSRKRTGFLMLGTQIPSTQLGC